MLKQRRFLLITAAIAIVAAPEICGATDLLAKTARDELDRLEERVPTFHRVELPAGAGTVRLRPEQALTIEQLRDVTLDDAPPHLGTPPRYAANQTDDFEPGTAPYEARAIRPFRLRYFNCEFNYGGWHNFKMADYAATHGFNIIYPYTRKVEEGRHLPAGTQWLSWTGFDWTRWMARHKIPAGRYDRIMDVNVEKSLLKEGRFARNRESRRIADRADLLMIDMEHPVLPPERLREASWYPAAADPARQAAFEKKYYDGYARTFTAPVRVARKQGWRNISIYGWYPYGRTWGGLEQVKAEPGTDFAWNAFGRQVFEEVDLVNNSVYCFYWSPQNVAYTLANIDANIRMTGNRKPVRPYYWTLLHGGGGGWRWWRGQPLPCEEQRAMTAMAFFTGIDGFDLWNWSGTGNHHVVTFDKKAFGSEKDFVVGKPFTVISNDGRRTTLRRYDAVHVHAVDEAAKTVRFQVIDRSKPPRYGITPDRPFYTADSATFLSHMRPKSEPVAAMIEGMALVKPLEFILRHGEVKIDVPATEQFAGRLPIVRRVKLGPVHVLITYDPNVIHGTAPVGEKQQPLVGQPRWIVLEDFDGVAGRTLELPADEQTRVFVLIDEPV